MAPPDFRQLIAEKGMPNRHWSELATRLASEQVLVYRQRIRAATPPLTASRSVLSFGANKRMDTCTLALEFNHSKKPESLGTVWIVNGDGRADLACAEPLQELRGWTRVAGPLQYETAASIHGSLKDFLTRSGVTVIDEGIAD